MLNALTSFWHLSHKLWEKLNPWQKCPTSVTSRCSFVTEISRDEGRLLVSGARFFFMVRRSVPWSRERESSWHHGAPLCDCRAPSEPGPDGSDVEPRLIHNFSYFSQRLRSRVGTVTLFLFYLLCKLSEHMNANFFWLQLLADALDNKCVAGAGAVVCRGKGHSVPQCRPPQTLYKQTNCSTVCVSFS